MTGINKPVWVELLCMNSHKFLLSMLLCLLFSCQNSTIPVGEYAQYFEKNHSRFTVKKDIGDAVVNVTYLPSEVYAAREVVFDTTKNIDEVLKKYQRSLFIIINVSGKTNTPSSPLLFKDGESGYSENILKNTFSREKDFFIISNKDTLTVAGYSFERSWGVAGGDACILTFNRAAFRNDFKSYRLLLKNIFNETGTLEIKLSDIVKPVPGIKR